MPLDHAAGRDSTRWATAIHTSMKAQGTRGTRWRSGVAAFLVCLCACTVGGWAADKDAFHDYINNRQARGASQWALFLGLGQTEGNLQEWMARTKAAGTWANPFTGEGLEGIDVLAFGQDNRLLEAARVIGDHLELYLLSPRQESKAQHWDYLMCQSNGCTRALGYLKSRSISARHVFAIGTDWTSMPFKPGDLRGASVTFFVNATDPVPVIPGFELRKVTEDTPGLGYSIAFERLEELPKRVLDRVTEGRADVDRFPVVHLDPPPGRTGLKAHGLRESYFPSIRAWMDTRGALQDTISLWI